MNMIQKLRQVRENRERIALAEAKKKSKSEAISSAMNAWLNVMLELQDMKITCQDAERKGRKIMSGASEEEADLIGQHLSRIYKPRGLQTSIADLQTPSLVGEAGDPAKIKHGSDTDNPKLLPDNKGNTDLTAGNGQGNTDNTASKEPNKNTDPESDGDTLDIVKEKQDDPSNGKDLEDPEDDDDNDSTPEKKKLKKEQGHHSDDDEMPHGPRHSDDDDDFETKGKGKGKKKEAADPDKNGDDDSDNSDDSDKDKDKDDSDKDSNEGKPVKPDGATKDNTDPTAAPSKGNTDPTIESSESFVFENEVRPKPGLLFNKIVKNIK